VLKSANMYMMIPMQYGVDITSNRFDDLDKRLLSEVKERVSRGESVQVLDVGCGFGGLAIALAQCGAVVTAVDIDNYSEQVGRAVAGASLPPPSVIFIQNDLVSFLADTSEIFDMVVLPAGFTLFAV
jgi:2-polyprenyl-3-methyl-5-hydroxy-6-metoxy-1,4-benzoquinol methylase